MQPLDVCNACQGVLIHSASGTIPNQNRTVTDNGIDMHEFDTQEFAVGGEAD